MLIQIPDNLARKVRAELSGDAAYHRRWAEKWERDGQHYNAVLSWVSAALLEADLSEPIQAGHLAKWGDSREVLVIAFDGDLAWVRCANDFRYTVSIEELTYAGPKPEGWGQ